MNVFISWSGEESKAYAEVFRQWLPKVIQTCEPFYSPEDIKAGMRWSLEIAGKLQETEIGILCLTRDNLNASWLMFEAGALSKQLESRVCPILFGLSPADVQGPLTQFQLNEFGPEGIYRMLSSINDLSKPNRLSIEVLKDTFDKWWPDLNSSILKAKRIVSSPSIASSRSERDLIEEILIRIRNSTVESPIDPAMVIMLVSCFGHLADTPQYIKDPEKRKMASYALYHFQFPIQHLITHISDTHKRHEIAQAYAEVINVFYNGSIDKDKLIENLTNPSHGLITNAPTIHKAD